MVSISKMFELSVPFVSDSVKRGQKISEEKGFNFLKSSNLITCVPFCTRALVILEIVEENKCYKVVELNGINRLSHFFLGVYIQF
jgi:hypothetical protein